MGSLKEHDSGAGGLLLAVGAEVCRARTAAGLTQSEFADRMDMAVAAVAELEAGHRAPSVDFLQRVAEACGAELSVRIRPRRRLRHLWAGR